MRMGDSYLLPPVLIIIGFMIGEFIIKLVFMNKRPFCWDDTPVCQVRGEK